MAESREKELENLVRKLVYELEHALPACEPNYVVRMAAALTGRPVADFSPETDMVSRAMADRMNEAIDHARNIVHCHWADSRTATRLQERYHE